MWHHFIINRKKLLEFYMPYLLEQSILGKNLFQFTTLILSCFVTYEQSLIAWHFNYISRQFYWKPAVNRGEKSANTTFSYRQDNRRWTKSPIQNLRITYSFKIASGDKPDFWNNCNCFAFFQRSMSKKCL